MKIGFYIYLLSNKIWKNVYLFQEQLGMNDLTPKQRQVLHFIMQENTKGDIYQKDIEKKFQITKSTVSNMLNLMEKNGYVKRVECKKDARFKKIIPSEKSETNKNKIIESMGDMRDIMLEGIPEEDLETCDRVLKEILDNLEREKEGTE